MDVFGLLSIALNELIYIISYIFVSFIWVVTLEFENWRPLNVIVGFLVVIVLIIATMRKNLNLSKSVAKARNIALFRAFCIYLCYAMYKILIALGWGGWRLTSAAAIIILCMFGLLRLLDKWLPNKYITMLNDERLKEEKCDSYDSGNNDPVDGLREENKPNTDTATRGDCSGD